MDEQVLEGKSDPPIPSDLTYPWGPSPWPPPGEEQLSQGKSLPGAEMVDTMSTLSSDPASPPTQEMVDALPSSVASFHSKERGSGLSMKVRRVGLQVPDGKEYLPGNPWVPAPLTHPWCLPPWPPPV